MSRERHNESNTRLYGIWKGMKSRCSLNSVNSRIHGKRGITICDEWANSYITFRDWALASGYKNNLSIDRRDNNGNYEPSNCRWTTQKIQSSNTRRLYKHNKSGYRGVSWNKRYGKWEVSIGIDKKTVKIGYYGNVKDAAAAYDTYAIKNKLPHTINGIGYEIQSNTGSRLIATNTSGYVGVSYVKCLANTNKPWTAQINIKENGKQIRLYNRYFPNSKEAAINRDKFIVDNKLKNKRNFTDEELDKLYQLLQEQLKE